MTSPTQWAVSSTRRRSVVTRVSRKREQGVSHGWISDFTVKIPAFISWCTDPTISQGKAEKVGHSWPLLILITGVITKWSWTLHNKSCFFILCYDALNLQLKSGTLLSESWESLSVEMWKSISDDPGYFNKQRSLMSYLLWGKSVCLQYKWQDGTQFNCLISNLDTWLLKTPPSHKEKCLQSSF